jgi:cytochrome bd-type quinol oxidase subunit 2
VPDARNAGQSGRRETPAAPIGHHAPVKLLVVVVLLAILASLGSGLFFLVKDKDDSRRVLRALTVRIVLSVALFLLLILAWFTGLMEPNATP